MYCISVIYYVLRIMTLIKMMIMVSEILINKIKLLIVMNNNSNVSFLRDLCTLSKEILIKS